MRSKTNIGNSRARAGGFSLVEVLITTVVLGVGILGVTGLQAVSKRAGFEAVQRSTAAELAYALLEDMRVNPGGLAVYLGAGDLGGESLGSTEPAPSCTAGGANCTPQEIAAHSLWRWERMLDSGMEQAGGSATGGLVSPTACIAGPAGGGTGDYVVTVVWRGTAELESAGGNGCGAGTGLYGGADEYRRLVVMRSYIDPGI